jgi:hypothetical protein
VERGCFDINEGKESPRQKGVGKAPGPFVGMTKAEDHYGNGKGRDGSRGKDAAGKVYPEVAFFQVPRGKGTADGRGPGKGIIRGGHGFSGTSRKAGGQGHQYADGAEPRKAQGRFPQIPFPETQGKRILPQAQQDKEQSGKPPEQGISQFFRGLQGAAKTGKKEDEKQDKGFKKAFNSRSFYSSISNVRNLT